MTITDYLWCAAIIGGILLIPGKVLRGVLMLIAVVLVIICLGVL